MNTLPTYMLATVVVSLLASCSPGTPDSGTNTLNLPYSDAPSFQLRALNVWYESDSDAIVFEMRTQGNAGRVQPKPAGQLDGAPVLGYTFLTSLKPTQVGFDDVDGTVALALTSHPDFDDTPLWDEDGNASYDDDGVVYHAHWVVLVEDDRAPGGLAVRQKEVTSLLPPTAPMPMYLDSPGFTVIEDGDAIRVVVPSDRIKRTFDFSVGAVTAYMQVDASAETPLLAVHGLLSSLNDGALDTRPSGVENAPTTSWPARNTSTPTELIPTFDVRGASAQYSAGRDTFVLSMRVSGVAGEVEPETLGQIDGATVLGYVFPTTIPPQNLGFQEIEGTVALVVTSHPDFDDTPLWDETMDADFGNDGGWYHVHWVVLVEDNESGAGMSVPSQMDPSLLPPTAPMPMYLDSPGYHAFAQGDTLSVVVPAWHLRGIESFSYDALTARMQVDASGAAPMLRVEQAYSILSGDLSLPYTVNREESKP